MLFYILSLIFVVIYTGTSNAAPLEPQQQKPSNRYINFLSVTLLRYVWLTSTRNYQDERDNSATSQHTENRNIQTRKGWVLCFKALTTICLDSLSFVTNLSSLELSNSTEHILSDMLRKLLLIARTKITHGFIEVSCLS